MAEKKTQAGYDIAVKMLKRNPKVEYKAVKAAADKKKLAIYPIMYGRAKAALGLVKVSKRGEGKANRAAAGRVGRPPGRPRGRPPGSRNAAASRVTGLDGILAEIRATERERDEALKTLRQIKDMISEF